MSAWIGKIRKARESVVDAGGHTFTIRRPTDMEYMELCSNDDGFSIRNCLRFVVGWDLTEIDLVSSGTSDPVPFDSAVFAEWVEDHSETWAGLLSAISDAYVAYVKKNDNDSGN